MPENFTAGKVTIFSSGLPVSASEEIVSAVLTAGGNDEMYVGSCGKAVETTVSSGAAMYVDQGGLVAGINIETGGVYSGGGICSNSSRWYGGGICATQGTVILNNAEFTSNAAIELNGWAGAGGGVEIWDGELRISGGTFRSNTATGGGGAILAISGSTVISGAAFQTNSAAYGGAIQEMGGTMDIASCVFSGNTGPLGGAIENHQGGIMTVFDTEFTGNSATQGGAIYNDTYNSAVSELTLARVRFSGNSASQGGAVFNTGKITLTDAVFATVSDSIVNEGSLTISGHNTFAATVSNSGSITFDLTENSNALLSVADDLSQFSGGVYAVALAADQTGSFLLADQWNTFSGDLFLTVGDDSTGSRFTVANGAVTSASIEYGAYLYTLEAATATGALAVTVTRQNHPTELTADADGVGWTGVEAASGYRVELSGTETVTVECVGTALDLYGLGNGDALEWQVQALSGGNAATGPAITTGVTAKSRILTAVENGVSDIFFAHASGIWKNGYAAVHSQTGALAATAGKNRFQDLFAGAADANILFLTDTANGDALFLDDVYSGHGAHSRVTDIDEIRAGAGDDVIDLTSRHFTGTFENLTLRGGDGNDTLWAYAKSTGNRIFGDLGNDSIVGSYGNDIIAGGAGDDTLSGLGGNDIFAFGGNWGADTVRQAAGGTAILWFAAGTVLENWSASDVVLTDGTNSVTLLDGLTAGDVEIRIGASGETGEYEKLADMGAFLENSSTLAVKV